MAKVSESTNNSASPTIYEVAPDWVELTAKLGDLLRQESELIAKVEPLMKRLGPTKINDAFIPVVVSESKSKPTWTDGMRAHLGRFLPSEPPPDPSPAKFQMSAAQKEAASLGQQLADVRNAISIIRDPQRGRPRSLLADAHLEGSRRLCDMLQPEYDVNCHRICAALIELGQAQVAHHEFMHRHRNAALSMLRPLQSFCALGDPREPASELRRVLEWAIEAGHFDRADLPKDWNRPVSVREFPRPQHGEDR